MKNISAAALLTIFISLSFNANSESIRVPIAQEVKCGDLAAISYWAATRHLGKQDAKLYEEAVEYAENPTPIRTPIHEDLVLAASARGSFSHGNAGPGNTSMIDARIDALDAALDVHLSCIQGTLQ